jgi:uncharacterized protein
VTRLVVLADTHVRRASHRLPDRAVAQLERADLILHAGDVLVREFLDELAGHAPVLAVLGNNDVQLAGVLPETRVLDIDGVRVAMVHDAGARVGRPARLRRRFPDADAVIFGHSHQPVDEEGVDGQRLFNPGSPTQRRLAPHHSIGVLEVAGGRLLRHEIIPV